MKKILIAAASLVIVAGIAIGAVALAGGGDEPAGNEVKLAVGETWTLKLDSNPTTGFQWQVAENTNKAVLEVSSQYVAPQTSLIGAGGQEGWMFKALQKGTTTVTLAYSRPWEGGEKAEQTQTITLVVS